MTAVQTTLHHEHQMAPATAPSRGAFDWAGQVRLGIVLTVAALIITVGLGGLISEPVLVISSMVVASILAWRRVEAHHFTSASQEVHLTRR